MSMTDNLIEAINIIDDKSIDLKLSKVKELLDGKKVIVAYSGGVDSSVVGLLAKKYARETRLIMQIGSSVAETEIDNAKKQASQLDLPIEFIEYNEYQLSNEYVENDENRCYYCKTLLFNFLEEKRNNYQFDLILSGTNTSDLGGHRPGHRAGQENGIENPLIIANISKPEVRHIANKFGLITANKPSMACLASRIVTGVEIGRDGLDRVAKSEKYIMDMLNLTRLRVRDHGKLARIEIDPLDFDKLLDRDVFSDINKQLKEYGFRYVSIDMEGYRPATP
jgi:uncharacterized protein (TIGR00268 family)